MIIIHEVRKVEFDAVENARLIATDLRAEVKLADDGVFPEGPYPTYFNDAMLAAAEALEKLDVARIKLVKKYKEQNKGE